MSFVKYITVINKVGHSHIREIKGYSDNLTRVRGGTIGSHLGKGEIVLLFGHTA
jgi:hypothetical protein